MVYGFDYVYGFGFNVLLCFWNVKVLIRVTLRYLMLEDQCDNRNGRLHLISPKVQAILSTFFGGVATVFDGGAICNRPMEKWNRNYRGTLFFKQAWIVIVRHFRLQTFCGIGVYLKVSLGGLRHLQRYLREMKDVFKELKVLV